MWFDDNNYQKKKQEIIIISKSKRKRCNIERSKNKETLYKLLFSCIHQKITVHVTLRINELNLLKSNLFLKKKNGELHNTKNKNVKKKIDPSYIKSGLCVHKVHLCKFCCCCCRTRKKKNGYKNNSSNKKFDKSTFTRIEIDSVYALHTVWFDVGTIHIAYI